MQCEHVLHSTMWPLGLESESESVNINEPLFTLPDSDSDSDSELDSKPNGYIALCRSFHINSDPDLDPYSDGFPNDYCSHFGDRCSSQGQMSISILLYFKQGIRVRIRTSGKILHSIGIRVGIRVRIRLGQWNKPLRVNNPSPQCFGARRTD